MSDKLEKELISSGSYLFSGDQDKGALRDWISPPILENIRSQITNLCGKLPGNEVYILEWRITKGKVLGM